jgi:hypothetical protein
VLLIFQTVTYITLISGGRDVKSTSGVDNMPGLARD